MTKPKKVLLAFLYAIFAVGSLATVWGFVNELIKADLLVGLVGSLLGLFQIALAFHVHWLQELSNEEWEAIEEIFKIEGGKEVANELVEHDSAPLTSIFSSVHSYNSSVTILVVSNAINVLEEKRIVMSKPFLSSGAYERVYSLNAKYKRIVKRLRFAL